MYMHATAHHSNKTRFLHQSCISSIVMMNTFILHLLVYYIYMLLMCCEFDVISVGVSQELSWGYLLSTILSLLLDLWTTVVHGRTHASLLKKNLALVQT